MAGGDDRDHFDAELTLRLAGERLLLNPVAPNGRFGFGSPIIEVASALVAIDAIPADRARSIARDYELALTMRGDDRARTGMMRAMAPAAPPAGVGPDPLRVARCPDTFTTPVGEVTTYGAWLDAERTVLSLSVVLAQQSMQAMQNVSSSLTDDQGTTLPAHFSGGSGSGGAMHGQLETFPGLAVDTAWLELGGHRLPLVDAPPVGDITVEALPPATPAQRHLWRCLTSWAAQPGGIRGGGFGDDPVETAAAVLVAAGALEPDDAALRQARAVAAALRPQASGTVDAPAAWRSLLSRLQPGSWHFHPGGGDDRQVEIVNASTPSIDGAHVRVQTIEVVGAELSISVDVVPGSAFALGGRGVADQSLLWWAEDDCGNSYLGCPDSGGWSGERSRGTVQFVPSLDPAATRMRLLPTGSTERAVIDVGLPEREDTT